MTSVLQRILLVLFLLVIASGSLRAQCGGAGQKRDVTNTGTEFLLCFEQNDLIERLGNDDGYLEIYFASLDKPAQITITTRAYPSLHRVINLPARSSYSYRITDDTVQYHGTTRKLDTLRNLWITSSGLRDDRVVHVLSSAPIVCYGMNHKVNTTDAFLALPRQTASTEYRIMSYPNSSLRNGSNARPSQFAVAAFSDGTDVTIVPAAPTAAGDAAGVPLTVHLNEGECVQIQTDPNAEGADLTGSVVTSNIPVAVYGSHARAEVPVGFYRSDGQTSRDHLTEAMPPVTTWGTGFIMNAIELQSDTAKGPLGDLIRVLALNANTSLTINGLPWTTLGANGFTDTLIHGPIVLQASGPVLVAEIAHTSSTNSDRGDPFMAIVPPVDQSYNDFTFFASEDPAFTLHKIIIVTDTETLLANHLDSSLIVLDNRAALPSQFFTTLPTPIGSKRYALTELGLSPGAHLLRTDLPADRAFTILMYGIGIVDSYGYTAGTLLKPLRSATAIMSDHPLPGIIRFRNALDETIYPDSMAVVMDHPEDAAFGVRVKESIYDIDRMGVGEERTIHLTTDAPLTAMVRGHVLFYNHSPKWWDLEPSSFPFVLTPSASVLDGRRRSTFKIYPNPMTNTATISVALPDEADLHIQIFDELGRLVREVANVALSSGLDVTIARDGLPAGYYEAQFTSNKLGLKERRAFIVTQ